MAHDDVLVVGAIHAGTPVVFALTGREFTGSMALKDDEVVTPYERPPLTKRYLAGDTRSADLAFRSEPEKTVAAGDPHLGVPSVPLKEFVAEAKPV
jgi:hypothetical protein